MQFAARLRDLDESATFKYSALAKKGGMINLTIGRTNFDTPLPIKEATKRALDEGKVNYTPTKGIPELRQKIVEKLERDNDIKGLGIDNVLVSAGAKQIIFEVVMALIGEGDRVAIADPSWVSYESIIKFAGGEAINLPLSPANGFIPDDEYFNVLENSDPKLIFLNSPNNPTGALYPRNVIERIVDIAERKDAWLVSDEIYEKLIYEGEHYSPAARYDRCITINGFSKEYSMTGWRLGYAACAKKELIEKIDLIQGQSVSCATSFVQYGAIAAYTREVEEETEKMKVELRRRRDHLVSRLHEIGVECVRPAGAFYVFPHFGVVDDISLADKLLENGLGVIPGSPFGKGGKGCLRLSYGASGLDEIDKAVGILERTLKQ